MKIEGSLNSQTKAPKIFRIFESKSNPETNMSAKLEAWTTEILQRVQAQAKMAVQVIVIIVPSLPSQARVFKDQLRHFLSENIPVPFVFASQKTLHDGM